MKITVLGCGAIGQLWLAALHRAGHEVQGWLKIEAPSCDINVTSLAHQKQIAAQLPANNKMLLTRSQLLIVTLKAWQVSSGLIPLLPLLSPECHILLLHNGMGVYEELPELTQPLSGGVTTLSAFRKGNQVIHVSSGCTHIGPLNASAGKRSDLAELLHQALPDVAWHNNILSAMWYKLAVNCIINPLTAHYQCKNGELHRYDDQIVMMCDEIVAVMNASGIHAERESVLGYVNMVIESTKENFSSMLQDVRAERHTEIDYITGHLLRVAHQHGLDIPENNRLFNLIKKKESDYDRHRFSLSGAWQ